METFPKYLFGNNVKYSPLFNKSEAYKLSHTDTQRIDILSAPANNCFSALGASLFYINTTRMYRPELIFRFL